MEPKRNIIRNHCVQVKRKCTIKMKYILKSKHNRCNDVINYTRNPDLFMTKRAVRLIIIAVPVHNKLLQ